MPFLIACPKCNKKLKIAAAAAGRKVKCPDCSAAFDAKASAAVPAPQKAVTSPPAVKQPAHKGQPTASKATRSEAGKPSEKVTRSPRSSGQKKKTNALLYGCLGAAFVGLLLVGLVVGGFFWLAHKAKKAAEEIVYTPPNSMPRGAPPAPPPQAAPPAGGQSQPQSNTPAAVPKASMGSKVLAGFDWKQFKDPKGRYTVLMPKTPREELPDSFTVTALEFGDLKEGVYSYSFTVLYDKREKEERTFEEQIKDWREANTDSQFKPLKDRAIQVKGHTGWEIAYKETEKKEYIRRWFVKLKQGVAMVSVNVPDTPDWIAAAEKFFGSFMPLDAPPQASASSPERKQPLRQEAVS